jgi:hypothetical protein
MNGTVFEECFGSNGSAAGIQFCDVSDDCRSYDSSMGKVDKSGWDQDLRGPYPKTQGSLSAS